MNNFAKIEDVEKLWRSLTEDEKERAKNLLPIVEDSLRMEADKVGKNLDRMIEEKSSVNDESLNEVNRNKKLAGKILLAMTFLYVVMGTYIWMVVCYNTRG